MSQALSRTLLALLVVLPAYGGIIGKPKKPYQDRPDDVPRTHVEVVAAGRHEYAIQFAGKMDGTMTRMPVGYSAFVQGWQPNRSVLIENVGQTDVVNPRLVVNGQRDWSTLESIVAEATRGYTTEADRARAIWEFARRHRFHACTWDPECSDAVKALNVYGYTLCGDQAIVLKDLWRAAGLKTRRCFPVGHCVTEVFYDGRFHLMDSDEHVICLLRDNKTIASEEEIVGDHDLVKRTHTYSIGQQENRQTDEFSASLYVYEGQRGADYNRGTRHKMDLVLRPDESIEVRWDHIGKQYTAGQAVAAGQKLRDGLGDLLAGWGPTAYDNLRNGKLRYRPDLRSTLVQRGTENSANTTFDTSAGKLRTTAPDMPAQVTWRFSSPYVFVGGHTSASVELRAGAVAHWQYSIDGKTWNALATIKDVSQGKLVASLDEVVSPRGRPTYQFYLQLAMQGDVAAGEIAFDHDIQTSALSLPELTVGGNRVVYADATPSDRRVRITHQWLERTTWHPPYAPSAAVAPQDGSTVEGTRVRFAWTPAPDPDGDTIVDYHFELSAHPDMRWPLSPNFEKRTSLTPSGGKSEWTVPYAGLLNPDTPYYWRVRALDSSGVWGPWSQTFRFQTRAPGVPLDLKLAAAPDGGWTLNWHANPQGQAAVVFKIYGSDERGFTASDAPYRVFRGKGFVRTIEEYNTKPAGSPDAGPVETPGNLIARTAETHLQAVGPDLKLPNTNKAFYRVVAIDAAGNESGTSDYVAVPRPHLYTRPGSARTGQPYRYQPLVISSLGDLRCRPSPGSSYNAAFWDREQIVFKATGLPKGLTLDPASGLITGMPEQAGSFEIVFEISGQPGDSTTVRQKLVVGN